MNIEYIQRLTEIKKLGSFLGAEYCGDLYNQKLSPEYGSSFENETRKFLIKDVGEILVYAIPKPNEKFLLVVTDATDISICLNLEEVDDCYLAKGFDVMLGAQKSQKIKNTYDLLSFFEDLYMSKKQISNRESVFDLLKKYNVPTGSKSAALRSK